MKIKKRSSVIFLYIFGNDGLPLSKCFFSIDKEFAEWSEILNFKVRISCLVTQVEDNNYTKPLSYC